MQRIESGTITQLIPFNIVETGKTNFVVYRSRDGAAPVLMTTPTVVEKSAANMPGEYTLLADEDMTMDPDTFLTESMVYWISGPGFSPVRVQIELWLDRVNVHSLNQFEVTGEGIVSDKWRGNGAA